MSAQAIQKGQSGRFIRLYLLTWGLLAACGLTYLASLALQVDFGQSQHAAAHPAPDPEQGLRVANKALAEIDNVQQTVIEMQKDLGRLKETVGEQEAKDKEAQSRLSALEERMSTLAAAPAQTSAVVVTVPPARPKVADKAKSAAEKKVSEQRPTSRIISVPEETKSDPAAHPDQPKLETGSITAPPPAISFGEPQVTPVRQAYSVQLGAGPSLDALRMNWMALRDQHADALHALQPRFVPPKGGSGPYRLVAGPLSSKADADKVCADMGMRRDTCFATTAVGHPL